MNNYNHLKQRVNLYENFALIENPFEISPLFRDFKDLKECEKEEKILVISEDWQNTIRVFLGTKNQRVLIYGLFGMGKTSLADFILYLAHNFHNRFCVRVVLSEHNIERALNELLLNLCTDILSEISSRSLLQPIQAIRKWIAEKRHVDSLLVSMSRLMGRYAEDTEVTKSKKGQIKANVSPGGVGGSVSYEEELEIRQSIQSFVDILPMSEIARYLKDFFHIVQQLGYQDIVFFIDEADHLPNIENFLRLLTRSREILFCKGYSFLIAGSVEVARHTESMGIIFDQLLFLKPVNKEMFYLTLERRLQAQNPGLKIYDVFDSEALDLIFEKSKGIRKEFLRMFEQSLSTAAVMGASKVTVEHCLHVFDSGKDEVALNLKSIQIKVLCYLAQRDLCSPSEKEFQGAFSISRSYLRLILEELIRQGYVRKDKRGRCSYYAISSQYRAYFAREASTT